MSLSPLGGQCFDTFADASLPIEGSKCSADDTCPGFSDAATAAGMWHAVLSPLAQGGAAAIVEAAGDRLLASPSTPHTVMEELMSHPVYRECETEWRENH